jgi:hypothetical protein
MDGIASVILYTSLLLHHFFLSIDMASHHERFSLYTMTSKRRTQGKSFLLPILSIFDLPWLIFTIRIVAPFFLVDSTEWQRT